MSRFDEIKRRIPDIPESEMSLFERDRKWCVARIEKLEAALKRIGGVTYGTELCNTKEENNEILASLFWSHQSVARQALAEVEKQ